MRIKITLVSRADAFFRGLKYNDAGNPITPISVLDTYGDFEPSGAASPSEGFSAGWFTPEATSPLYPHIKTLFFIAIKYKEVPLDS